MEPSLRDGPWATKDGPGHQYQWWLPGAPGAFMAAGVWGQYIYVDPARELVVVKTSVDPDFVESGAATVAFFESLAAPS